MFEYIKRNYPTCTAYSFTEYKLEDFPEDWLFNLEHDDDWEDWHEEHIRMYADVLIHATKCGCVGIWHGESKIHYYLHPSTRYDCMQLTCWDEHGPVGHANIVSAKELAREVNWREFTVYKVA